jgi:hypothetical protein
MLSLLAAVGKSAVADSSAPMSASPNWSGYIEGGGPFTGASATFNIPNLAAARTTTATAEWVGIDGASGSDPSLIQAGVGETYSPATNRVHLYAWWEILPAPETPIYLNVRVGDRVKITIGKLAGGRWQIVVRDVSTGRQFSTTQAYTGPARTVEWIVEAPTSLVEQRIKTLGEYTPNVTFRDLRLLGRQGALESCELVQRGAVVSIPSPLTRNGFSVAYGGTAPSAP